MEHSATYSPEDNKLRLYPACRLDSEEYAKVRAAGFIWAPKQGLFVAPMWTPERVDLLKEMCPDGIEDEGMSLADRQAARAERFEGYSEKRTADAHRAREAVAAIADGIPLGQPILVGHHSERHARRDADKIQRGMRKAVDMWETASYWKGRAHGSLSHASYKELPAVRARRIKGLEAELRKLERSKAGTESRLKYWTRTDLTADNIAKVADSSSVDVVCDDGVTTRGLYYAWRDGQVSVQNVVGQMRERSERALVHTTRWIAHTQFRLAFEREMLGDFVIAKPARAPQLPIINYAGEGFRPITRAEFAKIHNDYKGTRKIGGTHRVRVCMMSYVLTAEERATGKHFYGSVPVYLSDVKQTQPPAPKSAVVPDAPPIDHAALAADLKRREERLQASAIEAAADAPFVALKAAVKAGVQVVSAPQLFPTPAAVVARMVEFADLVAGMRVLEPSAGTGAILKGIAAAGVAVDVQSVEINGRLAQALPGQVRCADFLECTRHEIGDFDRVLMNPPFENGADIKHITRALTFLKPGGRIVAICADGPRQRTQLQPLADYWEDLPSGTFEGTQVRAALLVINGGAE